MDLKLMTLLQLAFDLVAGGLILWCVLRGGTSSKSFSKMHGALLKEIDARMRQFQDTVNELMEGLDCRLQKLQEAAEELDRAEIRACETLERLQKAKGNFQGAQASYDAAAQWLRQGFPMAEVARRSGLGLGELELIQHLGVKDTAQA